MYVLINIAYVGTRLAKLRTARPTDTTQMLVVPKHLQYQKGGDTVASYYFQAIFGAKSAKQVLDGLIAFSSLGNNIVQTFTAARVKQEIAKEGILPFSQFFAKNTSFRRRRTATAVAPETSEDTPVGALLLHWTFALLLILVSIPLVPNDAYKTFTPSQSTLSLGFV
jgi:amino acid transporter